MDQWQLFLAMTPVQQIGVLLLIVLEAWVVFWVYCKILRLIRWVFGLFEKLYSRTRQ